MDEKRITGAAKEAVGKVEGAAGNLVGDQRIQNRGAVREAEGAVENLVGQATDAVRGLAGQATEVAGKVAEAASQATGGATGRAADLAQDAYAQGRRYLDEGRRRYAPEAERYYREGSRAVRAQVEEAPLLALFVAGAVGFALGWLIAGRR